MSARPAPTPYEREVARYFLEGHTVDDLARGYHLPRRRLEQILRRALQLRAAPPEDTKP